jgi:hypothetical protein
MLRLERDALAVVESNANDACKYCSSEGEWVNATSQSHESFVEEERMTTEDKKEVKVADTVSGVCPWTPPFATKHHTPLLPSAHPPLTPNHRSRYIEFPSITSRNPCLVLLYFYYQIPEKLSRVPYFLDPQPIDCVCYAPALPISTGPLFLQYADVFSGKRQQQSKLRGDLGAGRQGPRFVDPSCGFDPIVNGVDL